MTEHLEKEIELRTEEVTEILESPPNWLFNWGMVIIFSLLALGVALSHFISYPDILVAKATVTTLNPPVTIVARTSGKVSALLVKDNQEVHKGSILAILENTADYHNVLKMSEDIQVLAANIKLDKSLPNFSFDDSLKMGELTAAYLQFLKAYKDYKLFAEIKPQKKEIALLEREIISQNQLLSKYEQQVKLYDDELSLIEKDYMRDQGLFKAGLISARDFENKKKDFVRAQSASETLKIAHANTKIAINNIDKNKLQLNMLHMEQVSKYKIELEQSMKNLQSSIEAWKQDFLFISPIDGTVSFFNFWTANQNIKAGDEAFNVVPLDKLNFIARLVLPIQNSGKLKIGQTVNIKLENYPFAEYGILKGRVKNISLAVSNNNYAIDVELPNGLQTTYNKELSYRNEMSGQGEVITDNNSLLIRLFGKFRNILKRA